MSSFAVKCYNKKITGFHFSEDEKKRKTFSKMIVFKKDNFFKLKKTKKSSVKNPNIVHFQMLSSIFLRYKFCYIFLVTNPYAKNQNRKWQIDSLKKF